MKRKLKSLDFDSIILTKLMVGLFMLIATSVNMGKTGQIGTLETLSVAKQSIPIPAFNLKSLLEMPEIAVYLIFGTYMALFRNMNERYRQRFTEHPTLNFVSDLLLFTAFHKLILLPECGFGYAQWATLLFVYLFESGYVFESRRAGKLSFNTAQIIIVGTLLWFVKLFCRYVLPQNLSDGIVNNDIAMNILMIFLAIAAAYGIKTAFSSLKINGMSKAVSVTAKVTGGIVKTVMWLFAKLFSIIINLVVTFVANPVVLLIIVAVAVLLMLLGGLTVMVNVDGFITHITNDFKALVMPIMRKALSTDNPAYSDDSLTTIGSMISYLSFMIAIVFEGNSVRSIEEETLQIENEEKQAQARIEEHKQTEYDIFFKNTSADKQNISEVLK